MKSPLMIVPPILISKRRRASPARDRTRQKISTGCHRAPSPAPIRDRERVAQARMFDYRSAAVGFGATCGH